MRPRLADILVSVVTVVFVLGALEIGVRIFVPANGGDSLLTQYDSDLGWRLKPNASGENKTVEYATREKINAKGFRGSEFAYDKPAGTRRILVLGDSFTEGYAVDLKDHFITRLQDDLNAGSSSVTQVINLGVAGYSTDQELLSFDAEGRKYAPDVTVLMFYYNDVWFNAQSSYWRGCKPRFQLNEGALVLQRIDDKACRNPGRKNPSRLFMVVKDLIARNDLLTRTLIDLGAKKVPDEFGVWKKDPESGTQDAWDITEALLRDLSKKTAESGSRLVVFYIPSSLEIDPRVRETTMRRYGLSDEGWGPEETLRRLKGICKANSIDLIDPTDTMKRSKEPLYFAYDGHWNKNGNDLVGQMLAGALRGL